jgi:polyisoprenoid-binding protein YceI
MTFRSTAVDVAPSGAWLVTGDLTVRGVTHP